MAHVFISYVRENTAQIDRLCAALRQAGVEVWLDREKIRPGTLWKEAIRDAIEKGSFFVACFSREYQAKTRSHMNEELFLAVEELRRRPTDREWFIPVLLSKCRIPKRSIGANVTLRDLQWVNLEEDWDGGVKRLVDAIQPSQQGDKDTSAQTVQDTIASRRQDSGDAALPIDLVKPSASVENSHGPLRLLTPRRVVEVALALVAAIMIIYAVKTILRHPVPIRGGYAVDTNAIGGSVVRVPDKALYDHGETVSLEAIPSVGHTFAGWFGAINGTSNPTTVVIDGPKSVTAIFARVEYVYGVNAVHGSVTRDPNRASYAHGEIVTLTAIPYSGYTFSGWSGDASGSAVSTTVVADSNKSVTALFAIKQCVLDIIVSNGSVTRDPDQVSYTYGQDVKLKVVPDSGYRFVRWSGDVASSNSPVSITMDGDKSVIAHCVPEGSDKKPPEVVGLVPLPDSIQVPLNTLVSLRVVDDGNGVDPCSITIALNNEIVYSGDAAIYTSTGGVCRRIGEAGSCTYAYQAYGSFDFDETVTVTVNGADLGGNVMAATSYPFRTVMRSFGRNRIVSSGANRVDKGGPATAVDSRGHIWAVWHAGATGGRDIYVNCLVNGARSFGEAIQLTTNRADQANPDIAIGADDKLYVVWQDNRQGHWDIYIRTSTDGVAWSPEVRVDDSVSNQIRPVIAIDTRSPNHAHIAWQDDRTSNKDIYVASSGDGFMSKDLCRVTSNMSHQTDPRITVGGSNTVYLVWTDYRNGTADVYGAASSKGPWTNVPVVTGSGNQSAPAIAGATANSALHFAWVSDAAGDDDILYAVSIGLPARPLTGTSITDDTSDQDQRAPDIAAANLADGTDRVFVTWQDFRNSTDDLDTDLYMVEIKADSKTNLLIGDGGTRTSQSEPAIGVDLYGYPYMLWTDSRNTSNEIYFAPSTFVEPNPLDSRVVAAATGGTVGVASPSEVDDVSVAIPAGAWPHDVMVRIARIQNLQPGLPADLLPYEFGPSGLQFDVPVTITIPYAVADYGSDLPQPYWYDTTTGTMSQQGITNIEHVVVSSTIHALRFRTAHFGAYCLLLQRRETMKQEE